MDGVLVFPPIEACIRRGFSALLGHMAVFLLLHSGFFRPSGLVCFMTQERATFQVIFVCFGLTGEHR